MNVSSRPSDSTIFQSASDRYELGEPLGEGGFGITFKATRLSDKTLVVMKQLRMERVEDWKAVELFERESKVLESLDHPRIPRYLDSFSLDEQGVPGGHALIQGFVEGQTLQNVMDSGSRLSAKEMFTWFWQMLEVCHYLHSLNPPVIHRDISPKNIMVRPDGEAFLIDFGTVQASMRAADGVSSTSAGTFGYSPLEQFVGRANPTSDLYGLAMSYVAVATGTEPQNLPFDGTRVDVRQALSSISVDARLLLTLVQMTQTEVGDRLESAPLVMTHIRPIKDEIEGATGPALLATEAHSASGSPAGRASRALKQRPGSDDSEITGLSNPEAMRWARARNRMAHLAGEAWRPPPEVESAEIKRLAINDFGTRAFVYTGNGAFLLDLQTMIARPFETECFAHHVTFSPNGSKLLIADSTLSCFVEPDGTVRTKRGDTDSVFLTDSVISPDGRMLASRDALRGSGVSRADGARVAVLDWDSGKIINTIGHDNIQVPTTLTFAPDGQTLFIQDVFDIKVADASGSFSTVAEGMGIAFSPDGKYAALLKRSHRRRQVLVLGRVASFSPFKMTDTVQCDLGAFKLTTERLRFAPDGKSLAVYFSSLSRSRAIEIQPGLAIIDVPSGEVRHRVFEPFRPDSALDVEEMGFSSDGRLFVLARGAAASPFGGGVETAVLCFAVDDELRYLGSLRCYRDADLFGETAGGLLGNLVDRPPKNFEHPEAVRAALVEGISDLPPGERAGLADLNDRATYLRQMKSEGRLDGAANLRVLVEASAKLTHILPVVATQAAQKQSTKPAFGQATERPPTVSQATLLSTLEQMATWSHAEHEVLFDEMIKKLEALGPAEEGVARSRSSNRFPTLLLLGVAVVVLFVLLWLKLR